VINGMLFKAKTGAAWRDLPERYGPWKTVYNRFWRWSRNGTLTGLVAKVRVIAEAIDELDREVSREVLVDSSIVRAHQHAAGARKATGPGPHRGWTSPAPGTPNQMIMLSDVPPAAPPPRSTWLATDTGARCRSC
jgi:transposase